MLSTLESLDVSLQNVEWDLWISGNEDDITKVFLMLFVPSRIPMKSSKEAAGRMVENK